MNSTQPSLQTDFETIQVAPISPTIGAEVSGFQMSGTLPQEQIAEMLINATAALYEDDPDNNPYDGGDASKIGFTAASIALLCRQLCVPIHIKWGGYKISSFRRVAMKSTQQPLGGLHGNSL